MSDVGKARVEVEGDVRNFARQTERELNDALSGIKVDPIRVPVDVDQARRSGEDVGREFGDGVSRSADGRLRDSKGRFVSTFGKIGAESAQAMTLELGRGLGNLQKVIGSHPYVAAAGIALAVGIAAAAAPALGALLSGAVIAAGGLGIIGLGAWLLREQPALKAAAKSLTDTLKKTFTDAAKPLLGPLVTALNTLKTLVRQVGPQFKEMFQGLADSGAIQSLATGLSQLVTMALPGFQQLITAAGPFLTELGKSLPILGAGLSVFFTAIADGGPGAAIFFRDFLAFIANTVAALGIMLGWLSSVYPAVRQFFLDAAAWIAGAVAWLQQFVGAVTAAFMPLVPLVTGVWQIIAGVVGAAWKIIVGIVTAGIAVTRGIVAAASAAIRGDWSAAWNAIRTTVATVMAAVRAATSAAMSALRSAISGAMSAVRAVWSAAWSVMSSIVTSAGGRIRAAVNGIRSSVIGAFAGAAGWLRSAGSAIINGLIAGIQAGIGRVKALLNSLTGMLPSWKGPEDVDRKILYKSGELVMQGFRAGLEDQRNDIRRTLAGLTGDLPTFTGNVRGGDGASSARPSVGASVTIMPGAIVVQGQGRQAGEEAAEAILERLGQATLVK